MLQNGRLIPVLVVVGVLASAFALLAGTNSSSSSRRYGERGEKTSSVPLSSQPVAATETIIPAAYQQLSRRNLDFWIPKNLPLKIRLKPEKEESFKDLKNEKWVHDFELEVKNTGTKPIYYLRFILKPDLNTPPGERSIALMVQYGRAELFYRDEPATPEDIPIQPNQTVALKVYEDEAKGWDFYVKAENLPDEKSKPQKATLYFEMLNFGDGTGYVSYEEEPFSVPKRDKPRPSYKQNPGPVNYAHPVKQPPNSVAETVLSGCQPAPTRSASAFSLKDLTSPSAIKSLPTLASLANPVPDPICNCAHPDCRYVVTQETQDCINCPPSLHAFNVSCGSQGSCKAVLEWFRACFLTKGDDQNWNGCPFDSVFPCDPPPSPTPTPTPSPTPSPTPTPIPCPLTSAANCPNGVPRDPCSYDTPNIPEDLRNGCPIFSNPSLDGLCCIEPCVAQPSPPQCAAGQPQWVAEPTCMWICPESPTPDPEDFSCQFDPCCADPFCCGDPCCLDPCCSDPSCGLDCFEYSYSACVEYCGVYDIYNEECIYSQWDCDYYSDVYCY